MTATTSKKPRQLLLPIAGVIGALALIGIGALLVGGRDEQLPAAYGRRRGADSHRSVNGTSVLAEFFKKAGHRVSSFGRLSPRLEDYDIIVWVPNDFEPPTKEQREFLEDWLGNGNRRTVVYVGRDYDAAVAYWDRVAGHVPAGQTDEALRRKAEARESYESARSQMPLKKYARWFTAQRDQKPRKVTTLSGDWADDIDATKADIQLGGRLSLPRRSDMAAGDDPPPSDLETLLSSDGDLLVTRLRDKNWGDGQVIVVTNGSFILNYPLVNHENRKLAGKLVRECGSARRAVFIESGPGGPKVLDKEPPEADPTALALLKVWPLNAIITHLVILGVVFCLARAPIFGRPRELPADSPADFGKHVAALGQLLARTQDRHYAQARLTHYRQLAERKSGRSHLKNK